MAKETPNEKRARKEKDLDRLSPWGISAIYEKRGVLDTLARKARKALGYDMYGTSASPSAIAAGNKKSNEIWTTEGKDVLQSVNDPRVSQAMREAAAEERREARGFKAGGKVSSASKRADGCAQRGKTRGKMV
jgi:hypothetical protein